MQINTSHIVSLLKCDETRRDHAYPQPYHSQNQVTPRYTLHRP